MKLVPYLYFAGTCEEAMNFYAAAGLGTVGEFARYRDAPPGGSMQVDPNWVMNVELTNPDFTMMASDGPGAEPMAGVSLTLAMTDLPHATSLFAALSDGGVVTMPMQRQFWGADFGMFTDRFGVRWQVNCEAAA